MSLYEAALAQGNVDLVVEASYSLRGIDHAAQRFALTLPITRLTGSIEADSPTAGLAWFVLAGAVADRILSDPELEVLQVGIGTLRLVSCSEPLVGSLIESDLAQFPHRAAF